MNLTENPLNTFNLFEGTFDEATPSLGVNSTADVMLKEHMFPEEKADQPTIDNIILADQGRALTSRKMTAQDILITTPDSEAAMQQAQAVMLEPVQPMTTGELFARTVNTPEDVVASDSLVLVEGEKQEFLHTLGQDPNRNYEEFINEPDAEYDGEASSIKEFLANNPATKEAIRIVLEGTAELLSGGAEGDVPTKVKPSLAKLLEPTSATPTDDVAIATVAELFGKESGHTLKDILAYASMTPIDAKAEVEFGNAMGIIFSTDGFQKRADRLGLWDTQMRTKFGEDYYYQLAAFMAKEGVIDGAALALALRNPRIAAKVIAKPGANLWGRFGAAVKRSAFVGVVGGSAQAGINSYVYDDPNIAPEVATRFGGFLVGEGMVAGGGKLKGLVGTAMVAGKQLFAPAIQKSLKVVDQQAIDRAILELNPLASSTLTASPSLLEISAKAIDTDGSLLPYKTLAKDTETVLIQQPAAVGNLNTSEVSRALAATAERTKLEEDILALGFTDRVVGEVTSRQTKITGILDQYIDNKIKAVDYRPPGLKTKIDVGVVKTWIGNPEQYLGDVTKDAFDVYNLTSLYRGTLAKASDAALKGIKGDDLGKVYDVRLKYESDFADGAIPDSSYAGLKSQGLSDDQIDAFYSLDRLSRFAIIQADRMAVKAAKENGDKMWQDRLVRVMEELPDGSVRIEELTKSRSQQAFKGIVSKEELAEVDRVAGFIPYHTPRRPENANWKISVINPADGTIRVTHALKNLHDTKRTFTKASAEASKEGQIAFYDRWVPNEDAYQMGADANTMQLIDTLDKQGVDNLREALISSGRAPEEIDNMFLAFDRVGNGAVVSRKILGKRSKTGLLGADGEKAVYKPAPEAFSEYMLQIGALPRSDFKRNFTRQFEQDFRQVLDPSKPWTQPIKSSLGNEDLVRSAKLHQNFMRDFFGQPTTVGKAYNNALEGIVNNLSERGKFGVGVSKILETSPIFSKLTDSMELSKFFRLNTSRVVFYGNVGSFLSQVVPSVAINVGARLFTNPKVISSGFNDMIQASGARVLGDVRENVSKEGARHLDAIRRSGYISEIDITDLADALSGQSASLDKYGMVFIKNGELTNRAMSFYMARREIADQLKEGTLTGISGKPFKGKEDDTEFLRLVTDRAQKLGLNMTPAGRLRAARGPGSVLLQYWSAPIKMANLIVSDTLPVKERVSTALVLTALFGPQAIPLVGDLIWAGDVAGWVGTGQDDIDNRQLLTSTVKNAGKYFSEKINELDIPQKPKDLAIAAFTKKGIIAELTDQQVDLVNRVTMSAMIKEQIGSIAQDPYNAFPTLSILKKIGTESGNMAEFFNHWYESNEIYMSGGVTEPTLADPVSLETPYQKQKQSTAILMGQTLNSAGKVMPMFGYISDIANNIPGARHVLNPDLKDVDAGRFLTRSGLQVGENQVTPKDLLTLPFGITPKIKREATEKFLDERFWTDTANSIEESLMDHYRNARGVDAKQRVLRDIVDQAWAVENALFVEWEGSLKRATKTPPDRPYKFGTLVNKWIAMTEFIDNAQRFGVTNSSKGE